MLLSVRFEISGCQYLFDVLAVGSRAVSQCLCLARNLENTFGHPGNRLAPCTRELPLFAPGI